jgi:MFS family permease
LVSRLVSAGYLKRQRELQPPADEKRPLGIRSLLGALGPSATGRMLVYFLMVQMTVQIAGPYFTPYMLHQLELSYAGYMVLSCVAYIARIVFLPACGRFANRYGADKLLWIGGVAIVPISALWWISDSFAWLCVAQVASGAAWAAYELATLLLFIEAIPIHRRVGVLTVFNLANSTAILAGSLLGGAILTALGADHDAYLAIFLISSCARAAALVLLARLPAASRAQRPVAAVPQPRFAFETPQLAPAPHTAAGHARPKTPSSPAPVFSRVRDQNAAVWNPLETQQDNASGPTDGRPVF